MNRKGQTIMMGVMVGIIIFMFGVLFVDFLEIEAVNSRAADALDCNNPSISDGAKLACLITELTTPYFIIGLLSVAGGAITARFLL